MKTLVSIAIVLWVGQTASSQTMVSIADSIQREYQIPELGYAVVSADSVLLMHITGVRKINTTLQASFKDQFRIGSNTKAITGFIAAQLVKQGKLQWNTAFFELFPELKPSSRKAYHRLTLLQLLSFRTRLFPYTYTYAIPTANQFSGTEEEQRYAFTKWFFQQKPMPAKESIHFSNLGYVAAGLMLEKASGKSYKTLVTELGNALGIHFGFGNPTAYDSLQTSGHDHQLIPETNTDNYKLNWLLAAGNIHATLPDYARFIQLQLKGLAGESSLLTKEEFQFLHYGLNRFAVGWFWQTDDQLQPYSYNIGNPGTFLTKVYVHSSFNRAFILFANAQTPATDTGLTVLYQQLLLQYTQ